MNAALTLFTSELRAKSRLFLASIVLAAVPFLATLLPAARGQWQDVVAMVGGFLALSVGMAVAVTTGSSVVVRELTDRRMSFWFAKPIPPAAFWFGRALASILTALVCFGIIAVPAMLTAGTAWKTYAFGDVPVLGAAVVGMAVLFLVTHAFWTVVRSRSVLLLLDFFFALVAAGALVLLVWPVVLGGAIEVMRWLTLAIAAAVLVVLAIAPVWQLEHGRADIRRSHAAFSRFFWPAIGVVLLVAGGYVGWLVSATPGDLRTILNVEQPPRGTKVLVTGTTAGRGDYNATFLVDTAGGSYERVATPWWGLESSKDGRVLAWLEPSGLFSVRQLEVRANGRGTGIMVNPASRLALSDDGSRVAVDTGRTVTVYDVATGRILGAAAGFHPRAQASVYFVNNDLLRVIETMPLQIAELDLRTRRLTRSAVLDVTAAPRNAISVSGDGTRMFVRGGNVIADAHTGATIAALGPERYNVASMLHDGSVVAVAFANGVARVRIFGADGSQRHELALAGTPGLWITGEVEGGKVLLATRAGMLVVDVNRGTVVRRLDGVRGPMPRFSADPRLIRYSASRDLVGRTAGGQLVAWKHEGRAEARPLLPSR